MKNETANVRNRLRRYLIAIVAITLIAAMSKIAIARDHDSSSIILR
jgi:hypothetical protein